MLLTSEAKWPLGAWREALQVFSEEKLVKHAWRHLGRCLLQASDETIKELSSTLSWWLKAVSKIVSEASEERWLQLLDRVFDCASQEAVIEDDPVFRAINHPVGHITEALIAWWYRSNPDAGAGLPEPLKTRLDRLANLRTTRLPHGRVIMAAHLGSLHLADPDWTARTLLPYFDWNSESRETRAIWEGYLWSPRISADLLDAFKPQFLATAGHYNDLGEHGRQYASLLTAAAMKNHGLTAVVSLVSCFA
jgi:hypothetical protein